MILQIHVDSNVFGKKGPGCDIKKFKEIPFNKILTEAKVAETEISLLWDFHLHSLSSADEKKRANIPYGYILSESLYQIRT